MTAKISLYGIKNCDTVKKARKWLDAHDLDFNFVDFRADGIDSTQVADWVARAGADKVLNKRGTTWRKLSPEQQALASETDLIELLCREPTLIKRPVLVAGDQLLIGFSDSDYQKLFN